MVPGSGRRHDGQRRRRHLDHDADGQVLGEGDALAAQLVFALLEHRLGLAELADTLGLLAAGCGEPARVEVSAPSADALLALGKVGSDLTVEQGYAAARLTARLDLEHVLQTVVTTMIRSPRSTP